MKCGTGDVLTVASLVALLSSFKMSMEMKLRGRCLATHLLSFSYQSALELEAMDAIVNAVPTTASAGLL
jgi:hypothetical protein